ncbi:Tetratricopeptide repeat-containing domain [Macleaya cordata]|uniref:Tetratricopeptide repeat-containing domain n=1 Tax=Macleaya cordata TaxID=56857 RepID=A0A200PVW1_MACCD|nr:Tetratricopeptide repeat-containing domain [Macleaya cordata]
MGISPKMEKLCIAMFESSFDKAQKLQALGKYIEAAESCNVILDKVESILPEGLPENFATDCKLQETLNKTVELLPELWKLAGDPHEAISSYRRALLHHWNLDRETTARIQKGFAIFLLYGGTDAKPPNLRYQVEGIFVPRNNIEEAILLLMILLRNSALKMIDWDPSIIDHLCYALSMSGSLMGLASLVDELLPGVLNQKESDYIVSFCYYGEGKDVAALDTLRKLLSSTGNPNCIQALLLASKICGENPNCAEEGVGFARRALAMLQGGCDQMGSAANCLLGISLSAQARSAITESEKIKKESEAIEALETAERTMKETDPNIIYHLSLENADQRKLDAALDYAEQLLKLEGESNVKGWILLARILSAHKRFPDAENVIDAARDQTGEWSQGELLQTKAKLQIAQGQLENAKNTFSHLLGILELKSRSAGAQENLYEGNCSDDRSFEQEIWHDLAKVYIGLSKWQHAEVCLSKSEAIASNSASRWHTIGLLNEAKGLHKEALRAFRRAYGVEPTYVPSLVSIANVLRQQGMNNLSMPVVESYLTEALRLDGKNHSTWYNLGLLYKEKAKGGEASASIEAVECFEAAAVLEESAPVEPFR